MRLRTVAVVGSETSALAGQLADGVGLDWTVNLQLDGRELPQHRALIDALPAKVVIDHTGKFLEPVTPDHAAFRVPSSWRWATSWELNCDL